MKEQILTIIGGGLIFTSGYYYARIDDWFLSLLINLGGYGLISWARDIK